MLRITKEADYGIMLLVAMADQPVGQVQTAREVAERCGLTLPMASKIMRSLARGSILVSHRGVSGGYSLDRPVNRLSVAEVIRAIEGPISMVQCGAEPGACDHEEDCPTRPNWDRINEKVEQALEQIPIAEMLFRETPSELIQVTDAGVNARG